MAITSEQGSGGRRGSGGSFGSKRTTTRRGSGGSFGKTAQRSTPNVRSRDTLSGPGGRLSSDASYGQRIDSGSGGGGGGGFYGGDSFSGGGMVGPMSAPAAPSEEDYLAGDAGYSAQLAALLKALELYQADDTAQRTRYETDYGQALGDLGYTRDDEKTKDVNEAKWDWEDQNKASGRAYQGQLNDFASRGMLQSSGYGRAMNDLQRSFNDQLGGINRARTDFLSQRDRDLAGFKNENTSSQQQARAEALARRAAQYGL